MLKHFDILIRIISKQRERGGGKVRILSLCTDEIASIYNRHVDTVYRIALMILKNREESEDAASTVFIKLLTVEKSFESDDHLKAWLIVTTQNTCRDVLKNRWYTKRVDYDKIEEPSYTPDTSTKENLGRHYCSG
jgi:RNA polymerase sigma-70 factor (ECF subfamily)